MKVSLDVEAAKFNAVMKEWLAGTSRALPDAINSRMAFLLMRAFTIMPPQSVGIKRDAVRLYMDQPVGERRFDRRAGKFVGWKSGRVLRRQHLIAQARAKKEGKKGLYGKEMRKAAGAVRRRAIGSVGYLKSAIAVAIRKLQGHFSQLGTRARTTRTGRVIGRERTANQAFLNLLTEYNVIGFSNVAIMRGAKHSVWFATAKNMIANVQFSIGIKDGQEGRVAEVYSKAMNQALRDERVEMERHLAAKVEQAAQEAVERANAKA